MLLEIQLNLIYFMLMTCLTNILSIRWPGVAPNKGGMLATTFCSKGCTYLGGEGLQLVEWGR